MARILSLLSALHCAHTISARLAFWELYRALKCFITIRHETLFIMIHDGLLHFAFAIISIMLAPCAGDRRDTSLAYWRLLLYLIYRAALFLRLLASGPIWFIFATYISALACCFYATHWACKIYSCMLERKSRADFEMYSRAGLQMMLFVARAI